LPALPFRCTGRAHRQPDIWPEGAGARKQAAARHDNSPCRGVLNVKAATRTFIGIDGCPAGWFCVVLDPAGNGSFQVAPEAHAVGALAATAASALIDIPIGLIEAGPDGRLCDREARRLLGPGRAASVFSAPARPTLAATGYAHALALNRRATGRGLSRQAWNLVPGIRAIDTLLDEDRALRGVLRECHPELCFWALNGGRAMQHSKRQAAGRQERLAVLGRELPRCRALFEQACGRFRRRDVARDDIIDALACALTAKLGYGAYRTLPSEPPRDRRGLPMEIVYCRPR
jgi:predicted RNase H-like nuclease